MSTAAEAARDGVRQAVRLFPPIVIATARGAHALFFGWGLFILIDVTFVSTAQSMRASAQAHLATPDDAALLATFFLAANLLPAALILRGTWGLIRDRQVPNPVPKFILLAILQTIVLAAIVIPLTLIILVRATGHGVSD